MAFSLTFLATPYHHFQHANVPRNAKASFTSALSTLSNRNFNTHKLSDDCCIKHAQERKKNKHVFNLAGDCPSEAIAIIDALQRTGIDYHFQEEIQACLERHHKKFGLYRHDSLHEAALSFRLLRQHGYYVSPDVFRNYMSKGAFEGSLKGDIEGLTSLYEASHVSTEEEDILDQAGMLCKQALNAKIEYLDYHSARTVQETLEHPCHKSLAKFMSKQYITDYRGSNKWIYIFQDLAGLDFKMVQSIHQKEIISVSKWWKILSLANELNLARNQPVKWHLWSIAILTDPSLSEQRFELTKVISLIYIIDDIFDIYGTLDELILFTDAVNRWDYGAAEQLPEYMKNCFTSLLDIAYEISNKIYKKHGWNPLNSLKKSWASLCSAFLVEAKWFSSGQLPSAEEYLQNAIISSGVHVVVAHFFFGVGEGITIASVNHLDNMPNIISSAATILRLCNDLGGRKEENQESYDGSYITCYMEEHKGVTMETAKQHTVDLIAKAWKCLNKECLSHYQYPATFKRACLNIARMSPLVYKLDGNHNLEEHKEWLLGETYLRCLPFL